MLASAPLSLHSTPPRSFIMDSHSPTTRFDNGIYHSDFDEGYRTGQYDDDWYTRDCPLTPPHDVHSSSMGWPSSPPAEVQDGPGSPVNSEDAFQWDTPEFWHSPRLSNSRDSSPGLGYESDFYGTKSPEIDFLPRRILTRKRDPVVDGLTDAETCPHTFTKLSTTDRHTTKARTLVIWAQNIMNTVSDEETLKVVLTAIGCQKYFDKHAYIYRGRPGDIAFKVIFKKSSQAESILRSFVTFRHLCHPFPDYPNFWIKREMKLEEIMLDGLTQDIVNHKRQRHSLDARRRDFGGIATFHGFGNVEYERLPGFYEYLEMKGLWPVHDTEAVEDPTVYVPVMPNDHLSLPTMPGTLGLNITFNDGLSYF